MLTRAAAGRSLESPLACLSRRNFLILGGSAVTVLGTFGPTRPGLAQSPELVMSRYPRQQIAALAEIARGEPVVFTYPNEDVENLLIKLGEPAGGGVGPDDDIVAFNTICTHMGGYMDASTYKPAHAVLGPCPLHLSTFDLSRHGMLVSGHATESLPQIVLEVDGPDVVATGVMGLLYGYSANPGPA